MSNLSDKELDQLSREAADLYEPDHSSLSWSRLELKLTDQMPERPPDGFRFGRINPYVWGPAVVLLAGVSFFLIKNNFYSKKSTRTNTTAGKSVPAEAGPRNSGTTIPFDSSKTVQNSTVQADNQEPSNTKSVINKATGSGNENSSAETEPNPEATRANSKSGKQPGKAATAPTFVNGNLPMAKTEKNDIDKNAIAKNKNTRKKTPAKLVILPFSTSAAGASGSSSVLPSSSASLIEPSHSPGRLDEQSSTGEASEKNSTGSDLNSASSGMAKQTALPAVVYTGAAPGYVQGNDSLLNLPAKSKTTTPYKSVRINRSLNFGLAFGPDYTDAGGIANNQLSNNIGITIGYYLTSKLSVNSGIFYSNKFYWSPGNERGYQQTYTPPGSSQTYAYAPEIEYVNGSCNMYEVPLTIRYDIGKTGEKTKFFVNAGLSSYFMIKQTYIYYFHNRGRALAWKTSDENQSNYWFGVADLSFGLETDMGKGFSFQAEPFFRIPLQQMGLENLKLNSYGVMLSFRYAPVLSRSKR